ncbi:MAG: ABC transporter substrate-binding protein [Myxococcota bacterium]
MFVRNGACFLALTLATGIVGCGDDDDPSTDSGETRSVSGLSECRVEVEGFYYIGGLVPFTGPLSIGDTLVNGIRQSLADINANGGVNGRPLGLMTCDSGCDGTTASSNLSELLAASPTVSGVVGAACSGATLPMVQDVATPAGLTVISPASSSPALTTVDSAGVFFRTFPSDALQGQIVSAIAEREGLSSVFVINRDDAYGTGLRDVFISEFSGTTGAFTYDDTSATFAADAINAAQAATPDGVFLIGFQTDGAAIFREAIDQSFSPTLWLGPDGLRNATFVETVANNGALEGMSGTIPAASTGATFDTFDTRYRELFGAAPESFTSNAYDATYVLAIAMELSANPEDVAEVRSNVANVSSGTEIGPESWATLVSEIAGGATSVDYRGASGPVDFDSAGDVVAFTEEWEIQGGQFTPTACWTPSVQQIGADCQP